MRPISGLESGVLRTVIYDSLTYYQFQMVIGADYLPDTSNGATQDRVANRTYFRLRDSMTKGCNVRSKNDLFYFKLEIPETGALDQPP